MAGSIGKISGLDPASAGVSTAGEKMLRQREDTLNPGERDAKVDEVARMYEKQFLGEMVKAMRSTVSESEFTKPSMAEKIYKDQMDEKYVEQWGDTGGIGLSNIIYDQIMQRYFGASTNDTARAELRQQGPLKLSNRDVLKMSEMPSERPNQAPLKVELKKGRTSNPDAGDKPAAAAQVQAPWDSTLLTQTRLPDGKNAVVLDHGSGFRSTLIFDGVPAAMKAGQKIDKGTTVGVLSPEINSFFWNLNQRI